MYEGHVFEKLSNPAKNECGLNFHLIYANLHSINFDQLHLYPEEYVEGRLMTVVFEKLSNPAKTKFPVELLSSVVMFQVNHRLFKQGKYSMFNRIDLTKK